MKLDDTLYFSNIRREQDEEDSFFYKNYDNLPKSAQFFLDIGNRFSYHRFVTRNEGEWTLPWKQACIPDFVMPKYDPNFKKTFSEVTDNRALEIKSLINGGQKFALMYSGGMDSTAVLVSLLKNLSKEELESIVICCSIHSIIENPEFWKKYIYGKFKIFDSNEYLYDDYINMGYRPITADEGDCIFGTSIGLQLYHNYDHYVNLMKEDTRANLLKYKYKISDNDVHYSIYKDIIIRYLALDDTPKGLEFGRILYEKYVRNIETSSVPVNSLHDFFWWLIFNVKYLNCSVRGAIFFNQTMPVRQCIDNIFNWFNGYEYQQWSMNNNNNGTKIRKTLATYKHVQKEYIYDFDKNDWYFYFKTKLESLGNLGIKGKNQRDNPNSLVPIRYIVGINDSYEKLDITNLAIQNYFMENLMNYQIDWTD